MWTCPACSRPFKKANQSHSCNDKVLIDFLRGKSDLTIAMFWHFIDCYKQIGTVTTRATKSMIVISSTRRCALITRLGKDFIDIVFPFTKAYPDNLCFHKIAQVPGTDQYNHHFRMYRPEDVNEEVQVYMEKAFREPK